MMDSYLAVGQLSPMPILLAVFLGPLAYLGDLLLHICLASGPKKC